MPKITPFVPSAAHSSAAAVLHYSGDISQVLRPLFGCLVDLAASGLHPNLAPDFLAGFVFQRSCLDAADVYGADLTTVQLEQVPMNWMCQESRIACPPLQGEQGGGHKRYPAGKKAAGYRRFQGNNNI